MSMELTSCTFNGRQGICIGSVKPSRGKLEVSDSILGANATQYWFTSSLTTGPGSNGLRLNRASADNTPLSIGFQQDLGLVWDLGLDGTTTDLALYSNSLAADVLRVKAATGQMQISQAATQPGTLDPQLNIIAGSAGTPQDGLILQVYGNLQANLALKRAEVAPTDKRVLLTWYKAGGGAGWQSLTDSAKNGTCDWVHQNIATGNGVLLCGVDDSVTVGSVAANTAFRVLSPKAGFFNAAAVAQQANASLAGIGSVTDANAKAALTAIRLALANLGLCAATA